MIKQKNMSCILHIETSTDACSVAVSQDGAVIFHVEDFEGPSHAQKLGTFVDEALSFTDNHAIPFDAVAVSQGPGSYTGLRIGVSMAKGICYARDLKLLALPTLKVMCVPVLLGQELPEDALLCPMIDARRMEVYAAVYDRALNVVKETAPVVVDDAAFADLLEKHPVYFFGNGADKCEGVIEHPNAHFIDGIKPVAKNMMPLAEREHAVGVFQDVAYFEPFYLKDFVAIKSNKVDKIIRG
jgi:tRNA threonylcarbamoyladenosine biosynthesis protein TsaB